MTDAEKIKQLKSLIIDRKSFLSNDPEFDEIFLQDIEALEWAVKELEWDGIDEEYKAAPKQDLGESM
jgi:hypothetical protein